MTFFDYETLKLIWWGIIGFLIVGTAVMTGFDMGITTLLPFIGKNDDERRVIINAIGPTWEGNQTWLIAGLIAMLGAWPIAFGTAVSVIYVATILMVFFLFLRPVAFDYRSKLPTALWRDNWDKVLFISGAVPIFLLGVAFGNLLLGLPFKFDDTLRSTFTGNFFGLLQPFAILCGLVSLSMLVMHGAIYLSLRTKDQIQARAIRAANTAGLITMILFAIGGVWVATSIEGYQIVNIGDVNTALNPLSKVVSKSTGAWLNNYSVYPWMMLAPAMGFIGIALALFFTKRGKETLSFVLSSTAIAGIICTAGFSIFPFILPSSIDLNSSVTLWDAVASYKTLGFVLVIVSFLIPAMLMYTSWVYRVMRGKVTVEHIQQNTYTAY